MCTCRLVYIALQIGHFIMIVIGECQFTCTCRWRLKCSDTWVRFQHHILVSRQLATMHNVTSHK